jgi:hypothetical protein
MAKGGLPEKAARRLLYYVAPIREALILSGNDYDVLRTEGRISELCEILVRRVEEDNEDSRARGCTLQGSNRLLQSIAQSVARERWRWRWAMKR